MQTEIRNKTDPGRSQVNLKDANVLPLSRLRHQPTGLTNLRMLDKKQCNISAKIITRLMDVMFVSVKCYQTLTNIITIMWAFVERQQFIYNM